MRWSLFPKDDLYTRLPATKRIDRRRHVRFLVDVPAALTEERSKRMVAGMATNIGAGGCYIEASDTFRPGTRVELALKFDAGTFYCHALVTYSLTCTGIGMGVAFPGTNLFDWLAHLTAESSNLLTTENSSP